jgi:hypothetical protein
MNCKNCHKALKDTQKYCDECGAKVIQNRLTPKIIANQINEQFISLDNKFLKTFIDLFKQPESVIVNYIEGTRKKYIDVLQYFAVSLTLAGIQVFLMTTFFKDVIGFNTEFIEGVQNLPGQENNPFAGIEYDMFTKYQGLIYILTVPLSALGSWLAYYVTGNRKYNYTEHLVLNLYYSAQIIIITAFFSILFLLFGLNYLIVSTILTLPTFLYLFYVLKRIFRESFVNTLAKFLITMIIYMVSLLFLLVLVIIILIVQQILNQ